MMAVPTVSAILSFESASIASLFSGFQGWVVFLKMFQKPIESAKYADVLQQPEETDRQNLAGPQLTSPSASSLSSCRCP